MPEEIDIHQATASRRPGPPVDRDPPAEIPIHPEWLLSTGQWADAAYWLDPAPWQDAA